MAGLIPQGLRLHRQGWDLTMHASIEIGFEDPWKSALKGQGEEFGLFWEHYKYECLCPHKPLTREYQPSERRM